MDILNLLKFFCDNEGSEAWTVLLRRNIDGGLVFKREWNDYKKGFGFLSQEYWIGNEKLSYLTSQKNYEVHINISYENGSSCYASYDLFRITDDFGNFNITKLGQYSGNADECMPPCPGNMAPGDCSCQKTFANPSGCLNTCNVHNCVCTDGFYLKGEDCVPLSECTRCQVNGINIPEGRSYVSADCTSRAECRNGQLLWDNTYACRANAVCDKRNNVWQCYTDDVDCLKVYEDDNSRPSGIYNIKPANWPGLPFEVYCNMADGGGWTVFQHREDGTFDFYQNWTTYRIGFGSLDDEHWLGNEKLYYLTNQKQYTLRLT
ncbi:Angiopoietin-1 [Holothuria leucospilota]|uniref:Angiopoietin-1 n=1 Tax=Holothuria leucospilota TaxID=206669 RepID=A0A9Q1BVT9_HOLLE|nr:Angiopoietin-1 [Holothuria leucospilota]